MFGEELVCLVRCVFDEEVCLMRRWCVLHHHLRPSLSPVAPWISEQQVGIPI